MHVEFIIGAFNSSALGRTIDTPLVWTGLSYRYYHNHLSLVPLVPQFVKALAHVTISNGFISNVSALWEARKEWRHARVDVYYHIIITAVSADVILVFVTTHVRLSLMQRIKNLVLPSTSINPVKKVTKRAHIHRHTQRDTHTHTSTHTQQRYQRYNRYDIIVDDVLADAII